MRHCTHPVLAGVYNLGGKLIAVEQMAAEMEIDIPDTEVSCAASDFTASACCAHSCLCNAPQVLQVGAASGHAYLDVQHVLVRLY